VQKVSEHKLFRSGSSHVLPFPAIELSRVDSHVTARIQRLNPCLMLLQQPDDLLPYRTAKIALLNTRKHPLKNPIAGRERVTFFREILYVV